VFRNPKMWFLRFSKTSLQIKIAKTDTDQKATKNRTISETKYSLVTSVTMMIMNMNIHGLLTK